MAKFPSSAPHGSSHVPTEKDRKTVRAMAAYGIPQLEIGAVIGINDVTLRKHYRKELDTSATLANFQVAQTLFQMATVDKNVAAAIFWAKTRMGMNEKMEVRHIRMDEDPAGMSDEDIADRIKKLRANRPLALIEGTVEAENDEPASATG